MTFPLSLASNKVTTAQSGKAMAVWLEGLLQVVNGLVGPSSKAIH